MVSAGRTSSDVGWRGSCAAPRCAPPLAAATGTRPAGRPDGGSRQLGRGRQRDARSGQLVDVGLPVGRRPVVDVDLLLLQLRQLAVDVAQGGVELVGHRVGRRLEVGDPGRDLVLPRLRLLQCRARPLLLLQRRLPHRLGRTDDLGRVRVDDVQEAHRRQHVPRVTAGEQQRQRGQRAAVPVQRRRVARPRRPGSRPARPRRRRRPSAASATACSACVSASRAAATSPCCACSPVCTSAARFCSSSSARLSSTPEVPPGWSLGSAAAGPATASTRAATATATRLAAPRVRHRERGSIGPPLRSGRPRQRPVGTDGVLIRAEPPGEAPSSPGRGTVCTRPGGRRPRRGITRVSLPRPSVRPVPFSTAVAATTRCRSRSSAPVSRT